ncbi:MAG: SPOR domain-containing protein [Candidatus Kapabacteria bacterium]|nr:SPOR domain-containing protein [Candidatus Kapabacteria bacterium]
MKQDYRPEEATGFEPETDRESFLLESAPYPGSLPWQSQDVDQGAGGFFTHGSELSPEEVLRLDEELRRILEEELQRSAQRHRARSVAGIPVPPSKPVSHSAAPVEIDLGELPKHPSQLQLLVAQKELPTTPPAITSKPRKGAQSRRAVLVDLLLVLLVLGGGALLWHLGTARRWDVVLLGGTELGEVEPKGIGQQYGQQHSVDAPFREVVWVDPVRVEVFSPLLQTGLPTTTQSAKTNQPPSPKSPRPMRATTVVLRKAPQHLPAPLARGESQDWYAVQVYASPSLDDAKEVAEYLRRQGAPAVVVSAVNIRGQTWWRVRFGPYATRLQAEQAALRFGATNAWIVRVQ